MFGGYWSSLNGEIAYLNFQATLKDHVIKGSCNSMRGSSSLYVINLPRLIVLGIVLVEI